MEGFTAAAEPAKQLKVAGAQGALVSGLHQAGCAFSRAEVRVDGRINRVLPRSGDAHINHAPVAFVPCSRHPIDRFQSVEYLGDRRTRYARVFGENRCGKRFRLGGKQDDKDGKLQLCEAMLLERPSEAAMEEGCRFRVEERETATHGVYARAPLGDRQERPDGKGSFSRS